MSEKCDNHSPSLVELAQKAVSFRDQRDWKQFHTVKDMLLSLSLEVAELSEHFQWKNEEESLEYISRARREIGEELSDVLYWILLISSDFGINLEESFERKLEANSRKYPVSEFKGRKDKYVRSSELPD